MKILVANLGSTSFKYRLYDLGDGRPSRCWPAGRVERIGSHNAKVTIQSPRGEVELVEPIADHGDAVQLCLDQLTDPELGVLDDAADVAAIGFKAVHARNLTGVHRVDEGVLEAMEAFADVAPAHNPPYIKAMRMLARAVPAAAAGRRLRDRLPPHDPRGQPAVRRSPTSGRPSSASAAGASTARAIATSPGGWPSCSAATTSRSSPATSAAARRSARSATASRWRAAWA